MTTAQNVSPCIECENFSYYNCTRPEGPCEVRRIFEMAKKSDENYLKFKNGVGK
jgi:hypothetical protein